MEIKEISNSLNFEFSRNGYFDSLGMITTPKDKKNMLVFLDNRRFLNNLLLLDNVTVVITNEELSKQIPEKIGLVCCNNPRQLFYEIHNYLANFTQFYWKNFESQIFETANINTHAYIASQNVIIGQDVVIEANVTILERTTIGDNVIIRAGTVIGSQGFEFKRIDDIILSVAHAGSVKIADQVEIQANCAISRGVFEDATEIGEYTKLDNLVHVAHGAKIGKRCLIAASAMIAGSSIIGDDVWIGPSACISNQITIGNGASISLGSVVIRDVAENQRVTGNFAINHHKFMKRFYQINKKT